MSNKKVRCDECGGEFDKRGITNHMKHQHGKDPSGSQDDLEVVETSGRGGKASNLIPKDRDVVAVVNQRAVVITNEEERKNFLDKLARQGV